MRVALAVLGFLLLTPCGLAAAETAAKLNWKVLNNFRTVAAEDQQRYFDDIEKYLQCAKKNGLMEGCNVDGVINRKFPSPTFKDYKTHWSQWHQKYAKFDENFAIATSRSIEATVSGAKASSKENCSWRVNGTTIASQTSCRRAKLTVPLGSSEISVVKSGTGENVLKDTIRLRDVSIGVIGDSFASGEGTPHIFQRERRSGIPSSPGTNTPLISAARWWDDRCHRSLFSNSAIAAARLAQANPQVSVTYISFACSGGEIDEGLLKKYEGRETWPQVRHRYQNIANETVVTTTKAPKLKEQVRQIESELCTLGRKTLSCLKTKPLDYLIISTGVNDIGFSDIVMKLATDDCDRKADACLKKVKASIDARLKSFVEMKYKALAEKVKRLYPRQVVLVEYPDPTQRRAKVWCNDFDALNDPMLPNVAALFGFGIGKGEAKWAHYNVVVPLNDALQKVVKQYGSPDGSWKYVGAIAQASQNRGYCNERERWFVNYSEALDKQGYVYNVSKGDEAGIPTGTMHPNILAHYSIAVEIEKIFAADGLQSLGATTARRGR